MGLQSEALFPAVVPGGHTGPQLGITDITVVSRTHHRGRGLGVHVSVIPRSRYYSNEVAEACLARLGNSF